MFTQQGCGYGTESRDGAETAFGHLCAEEALTEYLEGNVASQRVSRKQLRTADTCCRATRRVTALGAG